MRMINFAVGPVMTNKKVLNIGAEQVPYFRTAEFSNLMFENEKMFIKFLNADQNCRSVFITGSGTASMEAAIANTLTPKDKVLVINGGSFGKRFTEILELYKIPFDEICPKLGFGVSRDELFSINGSNYSAFLVNLHETSIGVLYDIDMISEYCKKYGLFLIVDAISCFLTDEIDMKKHNIDLIITGSQKALSCAPGVSVIVLSKRAIDRILNFNGWRPYYLDLKKAILDMERGQTPFTPAVSILKQINVRLKQIECAGGVKNEIKRVNALAVYFRKKVLDLPFEIVSHSPSNAVTTLHPLNGNAYKIFEELKNNYGIWVCPNGGEYKDSLFRVGHMGEVSKKDYDILLEAFYDLQKRGIL